MQSHGSIHSWVILFPKESFDGIDLVKGFTLMLWKAGAIKIYEFPQLSPSTPLLCPSWDIGSSINSNKRQSIRKGKTEGEGEMVSV